MHAASKRINDVQAPIIPAVADMIDANPGTISLGQGVVYFPPPEQISDGIARFSQSAIHHYQAVEGILELREAFSAKLESENGIDSSQYAVVVTAGSNMGFLNAILAICDPGDEVILPKPWYFNHEMAVRIANCVPVGVDTDSNYHPAADAIERAISPRTRAIVTISPNNPSGAVYRRDTLEQINELCAQSNLYHVSDEAYEYFRYGDAQHFSPASASDASGHTISLFSTSKCYALANWRIGCMLVPKDLFLAVRKIQDTNVICPPVISQFAAIECLKLGFAYCEPRIAEIAGAREHLANALRSLPGVRHGRLDGAFYALIEIPGTNLSDMQIVKALIEQHGVAVIPGQAFGIDDRCCLRVSYGALEPSVSVAGIDRLVNGLKSLLN